MLNKIIINRFENHTNSELDFSEGVNVITGVTSSGKSSIVKAINWLINNDPSGEGFIYNKDDKETCKVIGKFDKNKIEKYKDKKEHCYVINDDIYNKLSALRQSVPEQIQNITKFTEMNLKKQHDKFFLLQDTSGEVARKLNNIIDLSIMDEITKKAKSKVYKKNRDIEYLESDLQSLKNNLNKYDWLDNVEKLLNNIDKNYNEYLIKKDKLEILKKYNENYIEIKTELKKINSKLKNKKKLVEIKKQYEIYNEKSEKYKKLILLNKDYKNIKVELKKHKNIESNKKKLNTIKNNLSKLDNKKQKLDTIKSLHDEYLIIKDNLNKYKDIDKKKKMIKVLNKNIVKYEKINNQLDTLNYYLNLSKDIKKITIDLKLAKKDYEELLPEGSMCPFCKMKIERK